MHASRILLIDDEEIIRRVFARLLSRRYDVTTADSYEAAMQLYRDGTRFDSILADLNIPGLSLRQYVDRISVDQRSRIVVVSGDSMHRMDQGLLHELGGRFLVKTGRVADMFDTVLSITQRLGAAQDEVHHGAH